MTLGVFERMVSVVSDLETLGRAGREGEELVSRRKGAFLAGGYRLCNSTREYAEKLI